MMDSFFTLILCSLMAGQSDMTSGHGTIIKQQLQVNWRASDGQVHFDLTAPTAGWVAIGLNSGDELTGTYLIMTRVVEGQAEVVEHKVMSPGVYRPFHELGAETAVSNVHGSERKGNTTVSFSLPELNASPLAMPMQEGQSYMLLMAYSISDDFQHHSIMRTSEVIQF
ncbi:MAG: DOMON domain-containing protein [Cyclobacteriaceae bacterium]